MRARVNVRLLIAVIIAVVVVILLVVAAGGFGGSSSGSGSPATSTSAPAGQVQGTVTVSVKHLNGHTREFRYVIRNTGSVPISGFQLNARRSNLFQITAEPSWPYYGSGVCGRRISRSLIYWSTGTTSPTVLRPHQTAHFSFRVNTLGTKTMLYSLSWGSAAAQFGHVTGPLPSTLPANGECAR